MFSNCTTSATCPTRGDSATSTTIVADPAASFASSSSILTAAAAAAAAGTASCSPATTDDWAIDFLSAVVDPEDHSNSFGSLQTPGLTAAAAAAMTTLSAATETTAAAAGPTATNRQHLPIDIDQPNDAAAVTSAAASYEINTPTLELTSSQLIDQLVNQQQQRHATAAAETLVVAEMDVDVVSPNVNGGISSGVGGGVSSSHYNLPSATNAAATVDYADYGRIEDIWTLSPSSPDLLLHAAPLSLVEGSSSSSSSGRSTDAYITQVIGENSAAPPLVISPGTDLFSVGSGLPSESAETPEAPPAAAEPEVVGSDLLNWLINDTLTDSQIPGEEAELKTEEEELKPQPQVPPTTVDSDQLFADYYKCHGPSTSASGFATTTTTTNNKQLESPPLPTAIHPTTTRQRNVSTASSISSIASCQQSSTAAGSGSSSSSRPKSARGRGRPPKPPGREITPAVRHGRVVTDSDTDSAGNLTEAEISDYRYRRMRDLNNEASKRCRENRKRKFDTLEAECEQLRQRNTQLKEKLRRLEGVVRRVKSYYLTNIVGNNGGGGGVKSEGTTMMPDDLSGLWSV